MAISTYAELQTAVNNWLVRDDLTTRVTEFIALAENRIQQTIRVRAMETSTTLAMVVSQKPYALPTDYLQFRRVYVDSTVKTRLEYRTPASYWSIYTNLADGSPSVFTIEGENLLLGPPPDSTDNLEFLYYKKLAAFSNGSDTNTLLTDAAGLYLYGALIESAPFLGNDPRVLIWSQMWEDLAERVNKADITDRASGDVRAGWNPVKGSP